jgi:hypothetical protein
MNNILSKAVRVAFAALAVLVFASLSASAQTPTPTPRPAADSEPTAVTEESAPLTLDELKVLAAPIALYPDDLVALTIAASLYPLQIVQAARFLDEKAKSTDLEPSDKWDGSVISLLNYPDIIKMMNGDLEWTEQLGNAAADQQKDLLVAIQQLRDEAIAKDILKSTEQVQVVNEGDNVVIQSADPQTVYIPTYEPEMLYEPDYVIAGDPIVYEPYPSYYYPTAPYWPAIVTGAIWAAAIDWDDWGTWGGDLDLDVDIGDNIDIDFDKIDIDNIDIDRLKDLDLKNIDRSKLDLKNANIDRNKLKQNLKSKDFNNIASKAKDRREPGKANKARAHDLKGKDVRKNVAEGLKDRPQAKLPKSGTKRPDAKRVSDQHRKAKPAVNKPAAKKVAQKRTSKPKPAARVDNRPRKPSAMGNPRPGRVATNHSNRGAHSRGGGGRHMSRGGGGRQMHRGGGGRGGGGRRR